MNPPGSKRILHDFPVEAAAKRLRVSPCYLARLVRTGGWPYSLAERAARIYDRPIEHFLYHCDKAQTKREN